MAVKFKITAVTAYLRILQVVGSRPSVCVVVTSVG